MDRCLEPSRLVSGDEWMMVVFVGGGSDISHHSDQTPAEKRLKDARMAHGLWAQSITARSHGGRNSLCLWW